MDIWQSIPGMLFRFVLILWKKMLSLRAGGTSFDPEIKGQDGRTYLVFLNLRPGYDEVVFTRLQAKGCDIAAEFSHCLRQFGKQACLLCKVFLKG